MRQSTDVNARPVSTCARTRHAGAGEFYEALEPRQLLALTTPLPSISLLENQGNPVARIITNFGDIDIELFQDTNPNTVANFINYVEDGDYDQFFFHRLIKNFILQGGGFRFDDADGLSPVPTDPPLNNEFERSNKARTIAMAKIEEGQPGGGPNTATSQFFINLVDNSLPPPELDSQNGGFTVFAKVIGDISWNVVQGIANLPVRDLRNSEPKFVGQYSGNFETVPVSNAFRSVDEGGIGATEATLVLVWDIELIKAANTSQFYDEFAQYSEGFAGATINEFLPIGNPNNETVYYQVIARAETPQGQAAEGYTWFRDKVIATGAVGPNARGGITISHFGEGGVPSADDLVPQGVPYSLEVRSTKPLAVNLSHYDFGTSTGENFDSRVSDTWTFADATKLNGSINQFLTWYNPDAVPVTIDITFILNDGSTRDTSVTTDRYRRGGVSIGELGILPDNQSFSIRVESDRDIVVAHTGYDTRGDQTGFTELGIMGDASTRGVIPMGMAQGATAQQFITFLNSSDVTSAIITLVLSFSDGSPELPITIPGTILAPGARSTINLGDIPEANDGRRYTIRFNSGSTPVYAGGRNVQFADEVRYPVAFDAATQWIYAEGFMDPARAGTDVLETLSIYNPNTEAMGRQEADAEVTIRFLYTDGTIVTEERTIDAAGRLDIDIDALTSVLNQGTQNQRYFYSIKVTSDVPIVSQFWHHDLTLGGIQASGGFGELGTPGGSIIRLG